MAWWLLIAASAAEIVMALALKYAQGWTRLWPGVLGVAAALGSVFLLTLALRQLPAGTAYAVWTDRPASPCWASRCSGNRRRWRGWPASR